MSDEIQRYHLGGDGWLNPEGLWVRYADHAARVAALEAERDVGIQVSGSFFEALKPLHLTHIDVQNPGRHVSDLIAERDALAARLTAAEKLEGTLCEQVHDGWHEIERLTADRDRLRAALEELTLAVDNEHRWATGTDEHGDARLRLYTMNDEAKAALDASKGQP